MGEAVRGELTITADWERLDDGPPEESACFAALGIRCGDVLLTEGYDSYVKRLRPAPLLSAYDLAEWMAWNWWRLRWEPGSKAADWAFAHRLTTIGGGYIWPNITMYSDGERTALIAKPTHERRNTAFRYISDVPAIVPSRHFEGALDQFIEQVRGQLREEGVAETNLDRIWNDVREERRDPEAAKRRKLEALLGREPGEADDAMVERLVADAGTLGEPAMNEIAADYPQGGDLLTAEALQAIAARDGFDASPRDVARLVPGARLPRAAEVAAWRLGAAAARALREQERLEGKPITNKTLTKLAGVKERAVTERAPGPHISFALDTGTATGRVVLRSRWETGRRFELARLLGDRTVEPPPGRLFPATRAHTYRQKMQRSFAAEFLAPFEAVDDMLAGDYSMEKQQDAADHFEVSELTIRTLLVNHHRLEREELEGEFEVAAA
jgi:hypothetical protein